jgi:hypothetical protein
MKKGTKELRYKARGGERAKRGRGAWTFAFTGFSGHGHGHFFGFAEHHHHHHHHTYISIEGSSSSSRNGGHDRFVDTYRVFNSTYHSYLIRPPSLLICTPRINSHVEVLPKSTTPPFTHPSGPSPPRPHIKTVRTPIICSCLLQGMARKPSLAHITTVFFYADKKKQQHTTCLQHILSGLGAVIREPKLKVCQTEFREISARRTEAPEFSREKSKKMPEKKNARKNNYLPIISSAVFISGNPPEAL